jgi:hypothetical protein
MRHRAGHRADNQRYRRGTAKTYRDQPGTSGKHTNTLLRSSQKLTGRAGGVLATTVGNNCRQTVVNTQTIVELFD